MDDNNLRRKKLFKQFMALKLMDEEVRLELSKKLEFHRLPKEKQERFIAEVGKEVDRAIREKPLS